LVTTDGDLVHKLQSLPPEALDELLALLACPDEGSPSKAGDILLKKLCDPSHRSGTVVSD